MVGGCGDRELLWRGIGDSAKAGSARCSCRSRLSQPAQSKRRVGCRRIRRVLARNINSVPFQQQKLLNQYFPVKLGAKIKFETMTLVMYTQMWMEAAVVQVHVL